MLLSGRQHCSILSSCLPSLLTGSWVVGRYHKNKASSTKAPYQDTGQDFSLCLDTNVLTLTRLFWFLLLMQDYTSNKTAHCTSLAYSWICSFTSMEAAWPSGQRVGLTFRRSWVRFPALTTTWICFSVAPSLNPPSHLQITNWFASGQLGFLTMLCSVVCSANH